jgi:hypothetical protein
VSNSKGFGGTGFYSDCGMQSLTSVTAIESGHAAKHGNRCKEPCYERKTILNGKKMKKNFPLFAI